MRRASILGPPENSFRALHVSRREYCVLNYTRVCALACKHLLCVCMFKGAHAARSDGVGADGIDATEPDLKQRLRGFIKSTMQVQQSCPQGP